MITKKYTKCVSVTTDTHDCVIHRPYKWPTPSLSWDVSNTWSHTLPPPLTFLRSPCSWWYDSRRTLFQKLISFAILIFHPLKRLALLFSYGSENVFCVDNCVSKQHPNRKKLILCHFKLNVSSIIIHSCFCCSPKLAVPFQVPLQTLCNFFFSELQGKKNNIIQIFLYAWDIMGFKRMLACVLPLQRQYISQYSPFQAKKQHYLNFTSDLGHMPYLLT